MPARNLPATICVSAGVACSMLSPGAAGDVIDAVGKDPTVRVRLTCDARAVAHYTRLEDANAPSGGPEAVVGRKRDLTVLQRLGLYPGDVRPAHYLYALLFARIPRITEVCGGGSGPWEGCRNATTGAYEGVIAHGWQRMVWYPTEEARQTARLEGAEEIDSGPRLVVRPHHLMCMTCWHGDTGGEEPRGNDLIYELYRRIARDPEVPVTLVEGCCMACDCCDGYHPASGACTHFGGVIRDFKKDLDVFEKMGLMPGATLPARKALELLFDRVPSTRDICAYGDGVVRSHEWEICGSSEGREGYAKGREAGLGILSPS